MAQADIEHLRTWIGRERRVEDIITPRLAMSLDAVLDVVRPATTGNAAPVGIHWCLAPDIVPMREIGPDGHPARGGFLPPVPFPRRMWAGGELHFSGQFLIGDHVSRHSTIEDVVLKSGRSGEMIFVTVRHRYETKRGPVLDERQDIVYRTLGAVQPSATTPPWSSSRPQVKTSPPPNEKPETSRMIEASPMLLFRYSALTFNGHRIHYDHPYTTSEEGYPGLIFHGPLQATLLLGLATERRNGNIPDHFSFRSVQPLFAGGIVSLNARADGTALWITDAAGAATMTASC